MEFRDYYATMGVPRTATDKEVRARYRKLARELHPDVNKDPKATERFKRVNEAYEVLKDPEKRSKYDRLGADWEQIERQEAYRREHGQPASATGARARESAQRTAERAGARFSGFSDFFETFFGNRGTDPNDPWIDAQLDQLRKENAAARKGADTEEHLEISLAEAVLGGERTMHVSIVEPCPTCGGSGRVSETSSGGGTATKVEVKTCPACSGTGRQYRRRTLKVTIPKGVTEGSKIRMAGEGASGVGGGARGDLYLRVRLKLDRDTEVKGRNVYRDFPVRDYRAALGGKAVAEGPAGKLELTIPQNCPPGRLLRVAGKGIPALKASGTAGDLFLRVKIQVASSSPLPEAERAAYSELAEADGATV